MMTPIQEFSMELMFSMRKNFQLPLETLNLVLNARLEAIEQLQGEAVTLKRPTSLADTFALCAAFHFKSLEKTDEKFDVTNVYRLQSKAIEHLLLLYGKKEDQAET